MRCPFCGFIDTQVKDSRPSEDHLSIRRRRGCTACGSRFTTFERVQLCDLIVLKKNGQRELFDRQKLARSIMTATRKRPMTPEQVERLINGLVRRIETLGETEISSTQLGGMVMESLRGVDAVAYIRFASVYLDFNTAQDFQNIITSLDDAQF